MGAWMRIYEMAQDAVSEFGGSMDDFVSRVRMEFQRQMRPPNLYDVNQPPEAERPHVTDVFPDHCIVRAGDRYLSVAMTVTDDAIEFAPRADWQPVALQYVAEMPMTSMREIMVVSEFKGKYPDVPFAEGVDYAALVDGDDDPVFITVPIGKVNVTSGNKRHYDEAFVNELERQVIANRPVGLMGHLTPEQAATEFPNEAVFWVGAKRIGEFLWGKGYVPPGDARARLKRYKATNSSIATSIAALAEGVWDKKLNAFRMLAKSLKLNQIDIAPADRAGIGDLAVVPQLTTEMLSDLALGNEMSGGNGKVNQEQEGPEMDREEIIKSLTLEEVPETLRTQIATGAVQELRTELGLADGADVVAHVRELREAEAQREKEAVSAKITELVNGNVKLESVRGIVTELVAAKQPATVQEAETVVKEVLESESVKALLGSRVRETMGPNQTTTIQAKSGGKKYFQIPAEGVQV